MRNKSKSGRVCPECGGKLEKQSVASTGKGVIYEKTAIICRDCGYLVAQKSSRRNETEW